jgi:hypothetical protein
VLDHVKLAHALEKASDAVFSQPSIPYHFLQNMWKQIAHNPSMMHTMQTAQASLPIPVPAEAINDTFPVKPHCGSYVVLSVDGSQVYFDHHSGIPCYMLNIGIACIPYQVPSVPISLASEPYVFHRHTLERTSLSATDWINGQRLEYELQSGSRVAAHILKYNEHNIQHPVVLLFDGSLIFWHLDTNAKKETFFDVYLNLLHQLYNDRVPCAWYISMPHNKELMQYIHLACSDPIFSGATPHIPSHCTDAVLANTYLQPWFRSAVFRHNTPLSNEYPAHLHPHFTYLQTAEELCRIEFPAWVVHDKKLLNTTLSIIADQCIKGQGYPVSLCEAHEQAVIKGNDRDYFYHMIHTMHLKHNYRLQQSKKSIRKRNVPI